MLSTGNEGCNCINQTSVLASLQLQNRDCTTATGKPGVYLKLGGSCVTYDYGSSACLQHDLLHDPTCQTDPATAMIPPYCFQPWCFVDAKSCKKDSEEDIKKSDYFEQYDVFYSYSTCNTTDDFWQQQLESLATNVSVVGGINITATVPEDATLATNKIWPDGTRLNDLEMTDAYFDDTIPFGGIYIDYMNYIVNFSKGDIRNVTYTHTSRGSLKRYQAASKFTAAVRDVQNGLVDMAVGAFWVTGERLKMTSFTVPIVYDKTVLVIPKPGKKRSISLAYETQKVFAPFTPYLWIVVIAIILVAALLSVWFSDREMAAKKRYGMLLKSKQPNGPPKRRKFAYFRLILDAILEKGMFFFSAGIEQDTGASLPHKVLMFGFAFFILIAVSAYVANLAAFLTQTGLETTFTSMDSVIDKNIPICGHEALEKDIRSIWPKANWLFPPEGFDGMFQAHARGDCKVLAIGREHAFVDTDFVARVCEAGLVFTEVLIHENPIAFPIRPQLASAFSYWMYTAEKSQGYTLESEKQTYIEENKTKKKCEIDLSNLNKNEAGDFAPVTTNNMFLPITAFVTCVFIAVVLQLIHENKKKNGRTSAFGRKSTLGISWLRGTYAASDVKRVAWDDQVDEDDSAIDRKSVIQRLQRHNGDVDGICDFPGANEPDTGDEFDENGAPQSTHRPSIVIGSIDDIAVPNENPDKAVEEENEIGHRIEELVESGDIKEVLACFDFVQEMKKIKKDQ